MSPSPRPLSARPLSPRPGARAPVGPVARPQLALDLKRSTARGAFARARKAELQYAHRLEQLARHIGELVNGLWNPDDPIAAQLIEDALDGYAKLVEPWAASVGRRMLTEVAARDRKAWMDTAREMGRLLGREIEAAPTGAVLVQRLADQVNLITSLPREAAQRVHKLTLEGIVQGKRPEEITREILQTGHVTLSRARLIARTEVGRTATELTKARAEHVGSTHFYWRTAGDSDVRPSHRRLNGKIFRWDDPPECDPGHRALPGSIWNCRCYAEPIIPE